MERGRERRKEREREREKTGILYCTVNSNAFSLHFSKNRINF
jgi:hypothetical protein